MSKQLEKSKYIDTHICSQITGIPSQTLRKARSKKAGNIQAPPHTKINGKVRYDRDVVLRWVKFVYQPGKTLSWPLRYRSPYV